MFDVNRGANEHLLHTNVLTDYIFVFSSVFTERLVIENGDDLNTITKRKLLQVNAAAQYLIPNYTGSKLAENSSAFDVSIQHTKNKAVLVTALDDALKGLISSDTYLRKCGNTGMGFIIGTICVYRLAFECN